MGVRFPEFNIKEKFPEISGNLLRTAAVLQAYHTDPMLCK